MQANGNTFFQVYWSGSRETMVHRLDRARAAGAKGLIATLDWSFSNGRDWGSPWIPEKLTLKAAIRFAPQALTRPAWLLDYLKTGHVPDLTTPNLAPPGGGPAPTFFGAYGEWMSTPPATWDDVAWLREEWGGPFMLKGVSRIDDAKRAVDAGVTAISVSNHGGNNLDSTPASIRMLPGIAEAVGDAVEVLLDGGIRRGGDVAKALALGARAVLIGRAYLWGLAANGQAGVENVFDVLRGGLDSAVLGLGPRVDRRALARRPLRAARVPARARCRSRARLRQPAPEAGRTEGEARGASDHARAGGAARRGCGALSATSEVAA